MDRHSNFLSARSSPDPEVMNRSRTKSHYAQFGRVQAPDCGARANRPDIAADFEPDDL